MVSCHQQAGGAATRLIMSSLAGPGGLSEQEAAAVRRLCNDACIPAPRHPCLAATVRVRCAGTQGGLAEELAAARGEAGGGARPARERERRRGAAAGARGCVERPGLNGAGTRLHCGCVHAAAWQRRAWPLTLIEPWSTGCTATAHRSFVLGQHCLLNMNTTVATPYA